MAYPTNPIYKLAKGMDGTTACILTSSGTNQLAIPLDPDNTDYQEYLKWVDEGNTAEAAD